MNPDCPRCRSTQTDTRHLGRKACGILRSTAGAAAGFSTAVSGARVGALVSGFAGGAVGAVMGDMLDETVLNTLECLECGYRFSVEPE
ncbi:glycine zipper domain-containing protein [Alloalcanivorax marinus]|uniref:glycine zipper domain-containing protein n=1 Tax=Alloalcanivorax marinus TaxID=1177169 RepID=UPI0021D370E8|nr:hypothetical protein [Alloalcanivorax marinus]MCU5786145.1 hypothetical protein [Alloalcanivorax marinus]